MSIKCGRCGQRHESVEDVRACYNGQTVASTPEPVQGAQYRASDRQVKFLGQLLAQTGGRLVSGQALDTLAKRGPGSASELIDGMIRFTKGGPKPIGVAFEMATKPVAPRQVREEGLAKLDVPEGYYAVASLTGNNDLDFFRVQRPTEGKWKGYTFVNRVIGGRPNVAVRGATAKKALAAILAATSEVAAKTYGVEIGRCSRCNRHLTDEISRSLGIGPDCRNK